MAQGNSTRVPVLNRLLAALILLMNIIFSIAGLAAGVYAAFGESFFYSNLIMQLFPYHDSIFDIFRGSMRIIAGTIPALIGMAITHVIISYLIQGKHSALGNLEDMRKGFFYQLKHPFSNPRTPMNSREDENKDKNNLNREGV